MRKKTLKPLTLNRETLRALSETALRNAAGGMPTGAYCTDACTNTCHRPCTTLC
jgi:hypothetical protein